VDGTDDRGEIDSGLAMSSEASWSTRRGGAQDGMSQVVDPSELAYRATFDSLSFIGHLEKRNNSTRELVTKLPNLSGSGDSFSLLSAQDLYSAPQDPPRAPRGEVRSSRSAGGCLTSDNEEVLRMTGLGTNLSLQGKYYASNASLSDTWVVRRRCSRISIREGTVCVWMRVEELDGGRWPSSSEIRSTGR